ncbi:MAG: hypothetical protein ACR2H1_03025 [Limisphaerales bacterium]
MKTTKINRREFLSKVQGVAVCSVVGGAFVRSGFAAESSLKSAGRPLEIGDGPQLFLDDYLIERMENLKREVQSPQRHGPPILDSKTFGVTQPYLTVLRDDKKGFRMFYNNGPSFWHAESDDGIHWKNPRVAWERKRGYDCSVVDDGAREPDPSRRFKAAHWSSTIEDKPGDDGGMWVGFSPDGFNWKLHDKNPVLWTWPEGWNNYVRYGVGDTLDIYYDPFAKCYRVAIKVNAVTEDGYAPAPKVGKTFRRLIGMSTSKDFINWEKPWRIHVPDVKDDGLLEFYGMGGMHLRGGLHIGLVRVLRDDLLCDPGGPKDGIGYTALATSRDGVTWQRYREPFLDRNLAPGSWDHAMTWMSKAIPVGDEMFFYYGGYARGHKIEAKTERQIGLARMKKDRYVALTPTNGQGMLLTKPFIVPGDKLTINANSARGEVRVRLLDENGKPLKTLGKSEAQPVSGDVLAGEVRWEKSLASLRAKPVRLEFKMRNAAFYGFEFSERG